jgi:hypothetical protein
MQPVVAPIRDLLVFVDLEYPDGVDVDVPTHHVHRVDPLGENDVVGRADADELVAEVRPKPRLTFEVLADRVKPDERFIPGVHPVASPVSEIRECAGRVTRGEGLQQRQHDCLVTLAHVPP